MNTATIAAADQEGNNSPMPGDSDEDIETTPDNHKPAGPKGVAWSTYEDQKEQFQRKMCDAAKKYGFLQKLQGSSGDIMKSSFRPITCRPRLKRRSNRRYLRVQRPAHTTGKQKSVNCMNL